MLGAQFVELVVLLAKSSNSNALARIKGLERSWVASNRETDGDPVIELFNWAVVVNVGRWVEAEGRVEEPTTIGVEGMVISVNEFVGEIGWVTISGDAGRGPGVAMVVDVEAGAVPGAWRILFPTDGLR